MIGARQDCGKTPLKLKRGRGGASLLVRSHTERGKHRSCLPSQQHRRMQVQKTREKEGGLQQQAEHWQQFSSWDRPGTRALRGEGSVMSSERNDSLEQ